MSFLGKYFNSTTYTGRANVAKATYASFALMYVVYRIRRASKAPQAEEVVIPESLEPQEPKHGCGCDACQKHAAQQQEPKLSIPDDPLMKAQKKPCDCDKHKPHENHSKAAVKEDESEGCE